MPEHDDDHLCECICNHCGACTGCGICWLKAFYEHQEQAIQAFFRLPGGLT